MKFDLKKLGHNRDLWIVIGGAAAAVTAVAVLAGGRGRAAASSSSTDPYAQLPGGGSTEPDPISASTHLGADPILTAPSTTADPTWTYTPYVAPAPIARAQPVAPPVYYADAKGNPATLEQIFAQKFAVATPPAPAPPPAPRPTPTPTPYVIPAGPITWAPAYVPAAQREGYWQPAASTSVVTYPDPIIASSLKTPGGGLAYPAGVETYIGGGGQDLLQRRGEWSPFASPVAGPPQPAPGQTSGPY